jgi:hypothetical protein
MTQARAASMARTAFGLSESAGRTPDLFEGF